MARRLLTRSALAVGVAWVLVVVPLPGIPDSCVSLKNAIVILLCVVSLGKFLFDTFFFPRGPWGA